jgi:hypothetical protein
VAPHTEECKNRREDTSFSEHVSARGCPQALALTRVDGLTSRSREPMCRAVPCCAVLLATRVSRVRRLETRQQTIIHFCASSN